MGFGIMGGNGSSGGGTPGANGLSAYEIAIKNGFTGTEKEWLASLKGKSYKIEFDVDLNTGTLYQYVYETTGNMSSPENRDMENGKREKFKIN